MKKVLILCSLSLVISVVAQAVVNTGRGASASVVRESDSRQGWQLFDGQSEPVLNNISFGVQLIDGTALLGTDARYQEVIKKENRQTKLQLTDTQKQLDQSWVITALDDHCFTLVLTITNIGDKPLSLKEICPIDGQFAEKHNPAKPYILLNGDSMSKPLPTVYDGKSDTIKSRETLALQSPALATGYLTGKHNLNKFEVSNLKGQPILRAFGDCNGCLLMPGGSRQTDTLFLSFHDNPLAQLERYADLAGKINGARIWPPRVAWCSWYAGWMHSKMADYRNGLEKGVEENIPYVKKYFAKRGGQHTMRVCDDYLPHGDWPNKTQTIPKGFDHLAQLISDAGIIPGVWYPPYWASTESKAFKDHPEWFAMNKDGSTYTKNPWGSSPGKPAKPKPGDNKKKVTTSPESSGTPRTLMALYNAPSLAIFDTSRPDVQQYFEDSARAWRKRGFKYITNDYLGFAMYPPRFHDATMTKVEVFRAGLEAVRRGLGDDVFYRTISGPIGPRMGIADDLRISGDSHGDNPAAYYRTAQVWFYHRRLWLNDPSAVVCARYGELKPIEWNRMWLSWIALSGTVMTYGEVLEELPEKYINMYKHLFPPLPAAGRPLDIWENSPYLLWGINPGEADGPYVLFGVFDVQGDGLRHVRLNLDEIAARSRGWEKPKIVPQDYLLWDFWEQKLIRSEREKIELPLRAKSCYIFALRPKLARPQLLGTSGHFSQGVIETSDIIWNNAKKQLQGKVQGNGGDPSTLFFHLPAGMQLNNATLCGGAIDIRRLEDQVIALDAPSLSEPVPFELTFSGLPSQYKTRTFVSGRAALRFAD